MKAFWKPELWKFIFLSILALVGYAGFRLSQPLDFHESWSPKERQQIAQLYRIFCDARKLELKQECHRYFAEKFPRNRSWFHSAVRSAYDFSEDYSYQLLSHYFVQNTYFTKSMERMIEETAETANVSLKDQLDLSLLHLSLQCKLYDLTYSLVERGADVNLQEGRTFGTPLSMAFLPTGGFFELGEVALYQETREMVDYLLAHGAHIKLPVVARYAMVNVWVANETGKGKKDAEALAIYLFERGAPQTWKESDGREIGILRDAIRCNSPRIVRYLLDHGSDPSVLLTAEEQKKMKELLEKEDIEQP